MPKTEGFPDTDSAYGEPLSVVLEKKSLKDSFSTVHTGKHQTLTIMNPNLLL